MTPLLAACLLALAADVPALIQALGDKEYAVREQATLDLTAAMGRMDPAELKRAMALVREARECDDAEIRERAQAVLVPFLAGGVRWERPPQGLVEGIRIEGDRLYAWGRAWMGCYRVSDGSPLWETKPGTLPGGISLLSASEAGVFVAGDGALSPARKECGWLARVDPKDGTFLWRKELPKAPLNRLALTPKGLLVWGSRLKILEGTARALTKGNPEDDWYRLSRPEDGETVLEGIGAFPSNLHEVAVLDGAVCRLGAPEGKNILRVRPDGESSFPLPACKALRLAAADGAVYAGASVDRKAWLACWKGEKAWEISPPGSWVHFLEAGPRGLIAGGREARTNTWLGLYGEKDGKPVWEKTGLPPGTPYATAGGLLLCPHPRQSAKTTLLDRATGAVLWEIETGATEPATARDAGSAIFAAGGKGWLKAHRTADADREILP